MHPDRHDETPPLVVSHGYRGGLAAAFDWPGTRDFGAWLAAPTALDLHRGWGGTRLCARNAKLCAAATSYLSDRFGMANTAPSAMQAAMATLPLPGALPPEAAKVRAFSRGLWQRYRIEVPVLAFAGRAWLRISAQIYNRLTDYERLGDAIARSLADGTLPSAGAVR